MDYIEIRLAGDDERALERFIVDLRRFNPGLRFGRIQVGRKGDWLCYGYYDDATSQVSTDPRRTDQDDVAIWLRAYKEMRSPIAQRVGPNHPALQLLDTAIRNIQRWLGV